MLRVALDAVDAVPEADHNRRGGLVVSQLTD